MYLKPKYTPPSVSKTKKISQKQKDTHFSKKTGTKKKRDKKQTRKLLTQNELEKTLIQNKEHNFKLQKLEVEKDEDNHTHRKIKRYQTDELILELNDDTIKSQKINIFEFAKVLSRLLPRDISDICIHHALNDIYIEPNIFKIIPDDIMDYLMNRFTYEYKDSKYNIFEKYKDKTNSLKFINDFSRTQRYYEGIMNILYEYYTHENIYNNMPVNDYIYIPEVNNTNYFNYYLNYY